MKANPINQSKILYIIRHAKSSWKFDVNDFERPLKKSGENDAELVSNYLKNKLLKPKLIMSSDAERAQKTAHIFIENIELKTILFKLENELYDFTGNQFLNIVKSCDDAIDKLMIFGHNHAITNFVNVYGNIPIENVPTSGFVEIHFNINSWQELKKGKTERILFPKDLK